MMNQKRINRNIVECKGKTLEEVENEIDVLIETLWNVKQKEWHDIAPRDLVLIETLWNVKIFP